MSIYGNTRFVIAIPTRERCNTLESALRTCITQDYDNFEIVVSDNFSSDNTKNVVDSFNDDRIRYVNPGKRLSMSDNWEYALSHISGGYVMFLGDDDGLLPGALTELDKLIKETGCKAISWKCVVYRWPCFYEETFRNTMSIPLNTGLTKKNSYDILSKVLKFKLNYQALPGLYWGFISYEIIERCMTKNGVFFNSITPDIYSSIAVASVLNHYYYSLKPYSIAGLSSHSTGTSGFSGDATVENAVRTFYDENNKPFHHELSLAPSMAIIIAECFLQVRDHIKTENRLPDLDYKLVIKHALSKAACSPSNIYQQVIDAVKEIAKKHCLEDESEKIIAQYRNSPLKHQIHFGYNFVNNTLHLDCNKFAVKNIYDASLLCHQAFKWSEAGYFSFRKSIKSTLESGFQKISRKFRPI